MKDGIRSIYISGPMTGYKDYNHGAFNKAAQHLRHEGHRVWNPAEAFDGDVNHTWEEFMDLGIRGLLQCDKLIALTGWQTSVGARLEVAVALAIGMEVEEFKDVTNDRRLIVAGLLELREDTE